MYAEGMNQQSNATKQLCHPNGTEHVGGGRGIGIEFLQKRRTMTCSSGMVALAKHLVAIWQIDKSEGMDRQRSNSRERN